MDLIQFAFILKDILYLSVIVLLSYLFYKERSRLLDRIMATSYREYEYFQKQYEKDSEELDEARKVARSEGKEDDEIKEEMDLEFKKEKKFVKGLDENYEEGEVDLPKLRNIIEA